jgi:hypothetical protein
MNHSIGRPRFDQHPRLRAAFSVAAGFAALTVIVLFAWNSFVATVLGLTELDFRQALGLTLLLAAAGRLLSGGRRHGGSLRGLGQ